MSVLYKNQNNIIAGRYNTDACEVRFEARQGQRAVHLSITLLDGEIDLDDIRTICHLVAPHFSRGLGWVIEYEKLKIVVAPTQTLADRLTVCGLGIRGLTFREALDTSRHIGYFYMQPTF